jgi:hypothetical protein
MSTHPRTLLTPQEYLEIERKAEFRSEYHAGGFVGEQSRGYYEFSSIPCRLALRDVYEKGRIRDRTARNA